MDAEGLGRKLLLTRPATLGEPCVKQTVGTVTASHKMLTPQALSSSLLGWHCEERGSSSRGAVFESLPAVCPPEWPRPFARF